MGPTEVDSPGPRFHVSQSLLVDPWPWLCVYRRRTNDGHSGGSKRPDQRTLGVLDHVSPGSGHMPEVAAQLIANGLTDPEKRKADRQGRQVAAERLRPDLTRVEFMEFKPVATACCSALRAKHPDPDEARQTGGPDG